MIVNLTQINYEFTYKKYRSIVKYNTYSVDIILTQIINHYCDPWSQK